MNIVASRQFKINWNAITKLALNFSFGFLVGIALTGIANALLLVLQIVVGKTIATIIVLPLFFAAMFFTPRLFLATEFHIDRFVDRIIRK